MRCTALQGMVDYTVASNTVAAVMFVLSACAVVLAQRDPEVRAVARP